MTHELRVTTPESNLDRWEPINLQKGQEDRVLGGFISIGKRQGATLDAENSNFDPDNAVLKFIKLGKPYMAIEVRKL